MSRRIIVVDSNSCNRIRFTGELRTAHLDAEIITPEEALARPALFRRADLVLLGYDDPIAGKLLCRTLRDGCGSADLPIIGTGRFSSTGARLDALLSGVSDVFDTGGPIPLLLARIRSQLRARDSAAELSQMGRLQSALGFSEDVDAGTVGGKILHIASTGATESPAIDALAATKTWSLHHRDASAPELLNDLSAGPDLILIDARTGGTDRAATPGSLFRLIADIRANPETRHTGIIAIVPQGAPDLAIMALDLGANDLVSEDVSGEELAFRARALIKRKARENRFRDFVRNGLKAAITDPLTGLHNRRFALPQLARLVEDRTGTEDRQVAVLLIDIDHFKDVNDRFGHGVGDQVLVGVAARLRQTMRAGDLLARVGGEEFLVVLPNATRQTAELTAERLRQEISKRAFALRRDANVSDSGAMPSPIHIGPGKVAVTVSIGLALGPVGAETGDQLYARADVGLYAAKAAGRNTVSLRSPAA